LLSSLITDCALCSLTNAKFGKAVGFTKRTHGPAMKTSDSVVEKPEPALVNTTRKTHKI
jgi:hypothetical protein